MWCLSLHFMCLTPINVTSWSLPLCAPSNSNSISLRGCPMLCCRVTHMPFSGVALSHLTHTILPYVFSGVCDKCLLSAAQGGYKCDSNCACLAVTGKDTSLCWIDAGGVFTMHISAQHQARSIFSRNAQRILLGTEAQIANKRSIWPISPMQTRKCKFLGLASSPFPPPAHICSQVYVTNALKLPPKEDASVT